MFYSLKQKIYVIAIIVLIASLVAYFSIDCSEVVETKKQIGLKALENLTKSAKSSLECSIKNISKITLILSVIALLIVGGYDFITKDRYY
jgi:hypothetical protein